MTSAIVVRSRNARFLRAMEVDDRCFWCGHQMTLTLGLFNTITREHIYHRQHKYSRAGLDGPIVYACLLCNNKRGNMRYQKYGRRMGVQVNPMKLLQAGAFASRHRLLYSPRLASGGPSEPVSGRQTLMVGRAGVVPVDRLPARKIQVPKKGAA